MAAMTVNCPNCHTEIEVVTSSSPQVAVCPQCRNGYRVEYDDLNDTYRLQSEEPQQKPTEVDTDKV